MAKVIFMGSPQYAVYSLDALVKHHQVLAVVTQPDKPVGRKKVLTEPAVKRRALEHGLKVFQPEKVKTITEELKSLKPDFIITAAFGQFLPKAILDIPTVEALNLHGSILPKYRGGAPIQRAIMNLEKETGVSLMRMVQKMDAGPVYAVKKTLIGSKTTGDLMDELGQMAAELLIESLPLIESGALILRDQNDDDVTFAKVIERSDEIIDLQQPAVKIEAQVRALTPTPLASLMSNLGAIKLTHVELGHHKGTPGEILETTQKGIHLATGEGSIWLIEGIPAGKQKMKLSDFYRGYSEVTFKP
jgi:methionyl-tRNA formyltransferase